MSIKKEYCLGLRQLAKRLLLFDLWGHRLRSHSPAERKPSRYDTLYTIFEQKVARKRHIMEVGTYNGDTAVALIHIAKRYDPLDMIHYYGFDLFEQMDDNILKQENSKRPSRSCEDVRQHIVKQTGLPQDQVHLYHGFTQQTLWTALSELPEMDFIFIDGGHSTDTVDNDWRACQHVMDKGTVIIFDDYYQFDYGPRTVIDSISRQEYVVTRLEPVGVFPDRFGISPDGQLHISLVMVTRK